MKQNIINEIDTIRKIMVVISEKSENENLIEDLLEFEGFYDFNIMYSKSYYPGNGPLTHVLEMYFVKKDGEYARYNSGNAITVKLYFRVRNNEPYLVEMSGLPGSFLGMIPSNIYEKYFEEKGSKYLKKFAEHKGGFDNWH